MCRGRVCGTNGYENRGLNAHPKAGETHRTPLAVWQVGNHLFVLSFYLEVVVYCEVQAIFLEVVQEVYRGIARHVYFRCFVMPAMSPDRHRLRISDCWRTAVR